MRKLSALDIIRKQNESREYNAWFVFLSIGTGKPFAVEQMCIENDKDLDYFLSQRNEKWTIKQITKEQYIRILKLL